MELEKMLNSDDIEVALLAANILRKEKGKSYTANLVRKHGKYEFKKGIGLTKKNNKYENIFSMFNNFKFINTPLYDMTKLNNNVVYKVEDDCSFTFEILNKL